VKKILSFIIAMMAFFSTSVIYADDIVLIIKNDASQNRPRSGAPITACIEDGTITTESVDYSGSITIIIKDEDGDTVLSTVENVSVNSQFTTSVSNLDDGTYTIFYTLDNNTVYYGEFEKK
jgi:hypothetical protein